VIPINRTLKKSVGFFAALTISHAISRPTKTRPRIDRNAGRRRFRSADSADGDSVRASTAISGL
jgi:hypothetical protein